MINQSNAFNVNLNQFSGPLDLLLDLAKSQKVKIEDISITKLADQFLRIYFKSRKIKFRYCLRISSYGFMVSLFEIKTFITTNGGR